MLMGNTARPGPEPSPHVGDVCTVTDLHGNDGKVGNHGNVGMLEVLGKLGALGRIS